MEWLGYPGVESFRGLDLTDLPLNHAWVYANTTVENIGVYSLSDDCFNCPFKLERHLEPNKLHSWQVDTSRQATWRVLRTDGLDINRRGSDKTGWLCEMRPNMHEFGVYSLNVGRCEVRQELPPVHTYFPLILFTLVILGICATYTSINYLWKRKRAQKEVAQEKVLQLNENKQESPGALYVFRGFLLVLVIFLSTGGGGYPILSNTFGGLSLAECLFFAYIWSIGVNIPIVVEKATNDSTKCAVIKSIFVRAFTLILFGTAINFAVARQHTTFRLWCPLQKIGIAYFIVATAYVLTVQKFEMKSKKLICKAAKNLISLLWCWIISGFFLAIICILMSTFISFNCLGQLDLDDQRAEFVKIQEEETQTCNNVATEQANSILVGDSKKMINVNAYIGFSGGVMGVMTAIMYMMIGLKAGVVYLHNQSHPDRLKLWVLWASLFGIGGICFAVLSSTLNFNLWPISSILLISTTALYIFALIYFITEVFNFTSYILEAVGVTSLVVICGHMLFSNTLPFTWEMYFRNHLLYLAQNLWIVTLWLTIAIVLKKKRVIFAM